MRLLITGGSGFIGSNLVRLAIERGHQVLNLDKLTYAANPASLADLENHPAYRFVQGDICDGTAVREAFEGFRPDVLTHLAAETHVDRSIDDPGIFIQTNVTGTLTLLQAAREFWSSSKAAPHSALPAPRFLHLSTDEVFGSLDGEEAFTEQSRYNPRSPYSASKAAADHLVRAWNTTCGLPATIVHASNTYGPYQFPEKLIPLAILKALRGEPIPLYGDGTQIRDWLHVEDLTEALFAVIEKGTAGESYNIGGGNELTNFDLVQGLCGILDEVSETEEQLVPIEASSFKFESLIQFVPDRPGHDFRYALDCTKARAELGWQPGCTLDDGLRKTVLWYLEHESWWRPILESSDPLQRLGLSVGRAKA